jgi:hypothetical protein
MDQFLSIIFFDSRLKDAHRSLPEARPSRGRRSAPRRLGLLGR